jgi:uncharacterized membrane-anchored protein
MSDAIDRTLAAAIAAGVLPPDATRPGEDTRPWPVVLLTALGAWLAVIPLVIVIGMLLGDLIARDLGPYLIGGLVLAGALVTLRSRSLPLFVEQLAVPALMVGLGSLSFAVGRDLPSWLAAATLGVLALVLAAALPRAWLRVLLAAAAAALLSLALILALGTRTEPLAVLWEGRHLGWVALHLALAAWLIGLWVQQNLLARGTTAGAASALEAIGAGWLLAIVAGLALHSGMTMLVGAGIDPMVRDLVQDLAGRHGALGGVPWTPAVSAALVLVATLWGARAWSDLGRPWVLGVGAGLAGLAWFLPSLGGVWLALMVCATTWRARLAGAAALAAAWVIGSFYYQLSWPLAQKALILALAGALLGALVWLGGGLRAGRPASARPDQGRAPWLIALAGLATLAVANIGIWQREALIATGQPVFVELAPMDPRSLMQGDFMRLNFRIPGGLDSQLGRLTRGHPLVVARRDQTGVASLLRLNSPGEPLAQGEFLVELTPKGGRWTLVTDAWFFREGDGERWQKARYGEFRVAPDGQALLVGMADAELRPIVGRD